MYSFHLSQIATSIVRLPPRWCTTATATHGDLDLRMQVFVLSSNLMKLVAPGPLAEGRGLARAGVLRERLILGHEEGCFPIISISQKIVA